MTKLCRRAEIEKFAGAIIVEPSGVDATRQAQRHYGFGNLFRRRDRLHVESWPAARKHTRARLSRTKQIDPHIRARSFGSIDAADRVKRGFACGVSAGIGLRHP